MKRALLFLLLILALLILAMPIRADDTPEAAVTGFYSAYAAGDLEKAARSWESAARGAFARRSERHLRTRCETHHRVTLGAAVIRGRAATIDAEAVVTASSEAPGSRPRTETRSTTFELVYTGQWRIARWIDREAALADRVADERSAAGREALLANAGLRTPRLAMELCRRAMLLSNRVLPGGSGPFSGAERLANHDEAVALAAMARRIALESGDAAALATVRGVESALLLTAPVPDRPRAIEVATDGLALAERSGDPDAVALALFRLGQAQYWIRTARVQAPYERILALADFVGDASILSLAASELALGYHEIMDRGELRHALTALQFARESGDDWALANAHYVAGESYAAIGHHELAIRHFLLLTEATRRGGFTDGYAQGLGQLSGTYIATGRTTEALDAIEQALPCARPKTKVFLLANRASVFLERGEMAAAERDVETGFRFITADDPTARFELMTWLIRIRLRQGRLDEALDLAEQNARNAAPSRPREQLSAEFTTAIVLRRLKRFDESRARLARVFRMKESERNTTALDETHWSNFLSWHAGYDVEAVLLAVDTNDAEGAFRAAHATKARALRAFIERRAHLPSLLMSESERAREHAIRERIVALNKRIVGSGSSDDANALQPELEHARRDLEEMRARAATIHAGSLPRSPPLDDPLTLASPYSVIQYVTTPEETIIIGASPGKGSQRRVVTIRIPIRATELAMKIDHLRQLLESRDLRYPGAARQMFDLLLDPVKTVIEPGAMLCIIPDGDLWRVPFQALRGRDGRYVSEVTPLFYAPSLALAELASSPEKVTRSTEAPALMAFANPELHARSVAQYRSAFAGAPAGALPDAEEEVREVARLYGRSRSRVYIGEAATETNLKKQSGLVGIIHIATHGAVDATSPLASAMLLAPGASSEDGLLEASEILDLDIEADLAVLSACSTGAGHARSAEGLIGLSWAFLAGGCPTTVVSQWNATSSVTSRLMIDFHGHLRKGDSATVALQKAQRTLRRDHRYRHPYYWAPFVVVGAQ